MLKTCVVVADRARARLFVTVIGPERSGAGPALELQELEDLTDPDGAATPGQLFGNEHGASNRSPGGGQFEYDDHREGHRREQERRFAKRLADAIRQMLTRESAPKLVLAVEPHLLGLLRENLRGGLENTELVELAKDVSWHTPERILQTLTERGALSAG